MSAKVTHLPSLQSQGVFRSCGFVTLLVVSAHQEKLSQIYPGNPAKLSHVSSSTTADRSGRASASNQLSCTTTAAFAEVYIECSKRRAHSMQSAELHNNSCFCVGLQSVQQVRRAHSLQSVELYNNSCFCAGVQGVKQALCSQYAVSRAKQQPLLSRRCTRSQASAHWTSSMEGKTRALYPPQASHPPP